MAFDPSKNKVLWEGEVGDLQISVHSYNDGPAKLQIGPRILEKEGEDPKFRKAGRISVDEFFYITENADDIMKVMEGTPK